MSGEPANLFDLAVRYRGGDVEAGWAFALSDQIQACINYWVGRYRKLRIVVTTEDVQDLKADLTARVVDALGGREKGDRVYPQTQRLELPNYERADWNEAALVAWFRQALQKMTREACRLIIGSRVGSRSTKVVPIRDVPYSQMGTHVGGLHNEGIDYVLEGLRYELDPVEEIDRGRRLRLLAAVQRHFTSDSEANMAYEALLLYQDLKNWTKVALALGLPQGKDRTIKILALKMRNLIKSVAIDFGDEVTYSVMGVYTSFVEAGVCLMHTNGVNKLWSYRNASVLSVESFARRIRTVLDEFDVTFVALNIDDRSSVLRVAANNALRKREPVVELIELSWIEAHVDREIGASRWRNNARRRALLLAHAKKAQCELRLEGVA